VASFGVHAEVVAEVDHDTLDLLPVDAETAVVHEGAPEVGGFIASQIIDSGAGEGVDLSD
jgi:hypothetical protein